MKVGVQLPEIERDVRWPEVRAMALAAEDSGFDSLWVGDHLLFRSPGRAARGPWEAWSMLSALATTTSRVEIGPLVAATSFRNPAVLAKTAATVDEISGGRLILGLGSGWYVPEHDSFGLPFDHRVGRFAEAITIIATLLRTGYCDVDGEFYQARDCELVPRGPRSGGPPIMVGTIGPQLLAASAPYMDSWNAWYDRYGNRPDGLAPLNAAVDAAVVAAGRDPASIERTAAVLVRLPGGVGRVQGERPRDDAPPVQGPLEVIAEALAAFAAAGISHLQLVLDPITQESIELLRPVLDLLRRA